MTLSYIVRNNKLTWLLFQVKSTFSSMSSALKWSHCTCCMHMSIGKTLMAQILNIILPYWFFYTFCCHVLLAMKPHFCCVLELRFPKWKPFVSIMIRVYVWGVHKVSQYLRSFSRSTQIQLRYSCFVLMIAPHWLLSYHYLTPHTPFSNQSICCKPGIFSHMYCLCSLSLVPMNIYYWILPPEDHDAGMAFK